VTVAYGKDEVQDFGELLVRAQRDTGKVLVRDVLREVGFRKEMELERAQEEKRLRTWERSRGRALLRARRVAQPLLAFAPTDPIVPLSGNGPFREMSCIMSQLPAKVGGQCAVSEGEEPPA
jgi:hypothetical protein